MNFTDDKRQAHFMQTHMYGNISTFLFTLLLKITRTINNATITSTIRFFEGGGGGGVRKKSQNVFPLLEQCLMCHIDGKYSSTFKCLYCEGATLLPLVS